jgi:hypothetical protein
LYREICNEAKVVAGKHVVSPTVKNITSALNDGYRFIALGTDLLHLINGSINCMNIIQEYSKSKMKSSNNDDVKVYESCDGGSSRCSGSRTTSSSLLQHELCA